MTKMETRGPSMSRTTRRKAMNNQEIGAWIKKIRLEKGFSQLGLAQRLGISAPSLSLFESGDRKIPAHILFKISKVLGVSLKRMR